MGRAFAREKGLGEYEVEFARGAQAAQDPLAFESLPLLSDEDKEVLRRETTHRWSHPAAVRPRFLPLLASSIPSEAVLTSLRHQLYFLVICCSMAAATQGMVRGTRSRLARDPGLIVLAFVRRTSRSSTAPTCSSDRSSASTLLAAARVRRCTLRIGPSGTRLLILR